MGGWGFNVWDLIGQPPSGGGPDPEEERRRRLQEQAMEPVPEVEDLTAFEPPEQEGRVIQAPTIMGTEDPATADILGQYRDWASRRPLREEHEASTGRKILGGLAGFLVGLKNPVLGGQITSSIVQSPYRKARSEWEEEGETLGKVGEFAQDISKTRQQRESDVLGYEGTQNRIEAQRSAIGQRREAENLRHNDRMKSLTEDSEKRKEVARHNKELERLAGEANRIRNIEAGARKTSAEAYASRVGELNKTGGARPLPAHFRQAVMDEIGSMLAADSYAQQWFTRDPRNKDQIMVRPGLKITDPNDLQRFSAFLERAKARARQTLQIPEEDDVDDYNPLRQDVP